ncbi:MAG TPA: hypothetical protein VF111_07705 [Thermoanaerobaculia bacterium]
MKRLLVLVLLTACSSASLPTAESASTTDFALSLKNDTHPVIKPGQAGLDMRVAVTLSNKTETPYTIRRIEMASLGGRGYRLPQSSQAYDVPLAPGETRTLHFQAVAVVNSDVQGGAAPRLLRATIDAVAPDGRTRRETFTERVAGRNLQVGTLPYI